ncbi:uncharacterized protein N7511_001874 [Penicillium nucicola]|uniref:uncharacterized protein n=1 Tax=Penicillium nucicola TaxID=1850975 RepID=UPI002544F805|nr:uncharacterized protein N7511_001874 [Penicillium nucicola]KAJ5769823.1 hypothetical protein N7511_001874 [Penicillium nucicola]
MEDEIEVEIEKQALLDGSAKRLQDTELVNPTERQSRPFKKWMDSFKGRRHGSPTFKRRYVEGWSETSSHGSQSQQSNVSDLSQLGTVKTTTTSIESQSLARSRGGTPSVANQSLMSDVRDSDESPRPVSSLYVDEASEARAIKRRHVLREVIVTESDYVQGLKALVGVLTIFSARHEISHNIQEILGLHEQFLIQLQTISPMSEPHVEQAGLSELASRGISKRLGTIDLGSLKGLQHRSLRARTLKASISQRLKVLTAEPREALEVARVIEHLSLSFSAYDRFCSNYELLTQDVALLRRSIANWTVYDQGIEALSKSVASTDRRRQEEKRSMTLNDLLIKPIQRICKYPLMLQDLLRATPVGDCPSSHDGIRQILESLRTLVTKINSATGNPVNKDRIHKTLILQRKVEIPPSSALDGIYKDLGPMILCGVLHVTYQTPETTTGDFMVCILFNHYLLLAKGIDDLHRLEAVACVSLDYVKIDTVQNGQGLYCYGCLFSWKLQFQEKDNYEFVLSASSAVEEKQWNTEILKASAALVEPGQHGTREANKYSFLALRLAPLNRVQYAVSSLARRSSMDSMSLARRSHVRHVIIKKTHRPRNAEETAAPVEGEIERPLIPVSPTAIVFTARRIDRIRLERLIADVYTKDLLPLPGMVLGRGDLFRRGSIMRRLSLHTGFTKRSNSVRTSRSGLATSDFDSNDEEEGKDVAGSSEAFDDKDIEFKSLPAPVTPRRSRTLRFRGSPKKSPKPPKSPKSLKSPKSPMSSPSSHSEKRWSQDASSEAPSSPKKWSTPMNLFSILAPKKSRKPHFHE